MPRKIELTTEKDEETFIKEQLKHKRIFREKVLKLSRKYKKSKNKQKIINEITNLYQKEYRKFTEFRKSWDDEIINKCGIPYLEEESNPPTTNQIKTIITNILTTK